MLGITKAYAAKAVEIASNQNGSMIAYYPQDWMQTSAILSPLVMLIVWIAKEWWEHYKGDKKKIRQDLDELKDTVIAIRTILGEDLDEKIEKKIEKAFTFYDRGRRH